MLVRNATLPSSFIMSSFAFAGEDADAAAAIIEIIDALADPERNSLRLPGGSCIDSTLSLLPALALSSMF